MKKHLLIISVLLLLGISGFGQSSSDKIKTDSCDCGIYEVTPTLINDNTVGYCKGFIRDKVTEEPISCGCVYVVVEGFIVNAVKVDETGRYEIGPLPSGKYILHLTTNKGLMESEEIFMGHNKPSFYDFIVDKAKEPIK